MTVAAVAGRFQEDQRRVAAATAAQVGRRWAAVDPDAIIGSWGELVGESTDLVTVAQRRAAEVGARYTGEVVAAQGVRYDPAGRVQPGALAGVASDGRPLDTLLGLPASTTVGRVADGMPVDDALGMGRRQLQALVATQVLDAGRMGSSVAAVAEKRVFGYLRQLNPPSCSRCTILAGKWFGWNAGFARHPNCDCVHVPYTGDGGAGLATFDPDAYFEGLPEAEQDRIFTKAGAQAIRDGADMGQVVNARRGMRSTTAYGQRVQTTTVGTGRRQTSFTRAMRAEGGPQTGVRLMPEQIYRDAADRDDAIRLLGRFGYLA